MAPSTGSPPGLKTLVPLATIVLLVLTLRYAQDVLVPLCLAILLTFILSPIVDRLERAGIWRIPAVVIVSVLFIAATAGLAWMVGRQVVNVVGNLPEYRENIEAKLKSFQAGGGAKLKSVVTAINQIQDDVLRSMQVNPALAGAATNRAKAAKGGQPVVVETPPSSPSFISTLLGPMLAPVVKTGVALVLLIFMLANRETLRNRIFRLVGRGHLTVTTKAFDEAAGRVSRYLIFQSMVNLGYGAIVAIGLHFIGIPNPILWGVLSGLLRYLPYLGPIIGTALPTIFAIGAFEDWHRALYVLALYVAVEITTANFVEPFLYGTKTGITPLAILIAAIFWGLIWGPVGLLLSTPVTVCLVAFGKHIPQLEFLTILFGEETQLSPEVSVYQRLLADDPEEAREIAKRYLEQNSIAELYDSLLIPVLVMAEQDSRRAALEDSQKAVIFENLKELIEDLSEAPNHDFAGTRTSENPPATPDRPSTRVLAVPARDEGDQIAAIMLGHLLSRSGCQIDAIAPAPLQQKLREISERSPAVLCISAVPPLSIGKARLLYHKIKSQNSATKVIVCTWKLDGFASRIEESLGIAEPDKVATTIADSAYQIHVFCEHPF
jgi:predicted PurR-regulated permease PerM